MVQAYLAPAVGFVRVESCSTQAVLPLVGLAADNVIRDRYTAGNKTRVPLAERFGWQDIRVVLSRV